jgi:carbon dioxide concentrating mechanism protein CcmN
MSVLPLHLTSNFNSYISGDVTIDPSATIALGVLLHADPNSRIAIAAGVCIGMGTVLHAHKGIVEIETGAILGAGVLVVGGGKIGANACIGSATTIFNTSIEPGQIVAPGSLLGDTSRSIVEPLAEIAEPPVANNTTASEPEAIVSAAQEKEEPASEQIQPPGELAKPAVNQVVYGKASVTQLISTLFPKSQSVSQPLQDSSSQSQST